MPETRVTPHTAPSLLEPSSHPAKRDVENLDFKGAGRAVGDVLPVLQILQVDLEHIPAWAWVRVPPLSSSNVISVIDISS